MKPFFLLLKLIPLLLICALQASAQPPQIFIQLEDQLTDQVFRYHIGDKIQIKTNDFHDNWINTKIIDIIPEDSLVIFETGFVKIDDITRVRRKKGTFGKVIGGTLLSIGPSIIVFGTLGTFADGARDTNVAGPAIIGALVTVVGWLVSKTGRRKKFKIGKYTHLKIYDIRWPEPRRS